MIVEGIPTVKVGQYPSVAAAQLLLRCFDGAGGGKEQLDRIVVGCLGKGHVFEPGLRKTPANVG